MAKGIDQKFVHYGIRKDDLAMIEAAAKRAHKFNSNIDASVEIYNLGADY